MPYLNSYWNADRASAGGGAEWLDRARESVARAETVEQLGQAQAVVLRLAYGLSLEKTGRIIGHGVPWTCPWRHRFFAGEIVGDGQRQRRGGRGRQNLSVKQEQEVLAPFIERARKGGLWVVGPVKAEIEAYGLPPAAPAAYLGVCGKRRYP